MCKKSLLSPKKHGLNDRPVRPQPSGHKPRPTPDGRGRTYMVNKRTAFSCPVETLKASGNIAWRSPIAHTLDGGRRPRKGGATARLVGEQTGGGAFPLRGHLVTPGRRSARESANRRRDFLLPADPRYLWSVMPPSRRLHRLVGRGGYCGRSFPSPREPQHLVPARH